MNWNDLKSAALAMESTTPQRGALLLRSIEKIDAGITELAALGYRYAVVEEEASHIVEAPPAPPPTHTLEQTDALVAPQPSQQSAEGGMPEAPVPVVVDAEVEEAEPTALELGAAVRASGERPFIDPLGNK